MGAAKPGFAGAGRLRSGSGNANESSTTVHLMGGPDPLSWKSPTTRQVAVGAKTSIVAPPVLLKPTGAPGAQPEPLEFDWMFSYASIVPWPDTAMALHAVGF